MVTMRTFRTAVILSGAVALTVAAGCNKDEQAAATAEQQAVSPIQEASRPMTVTGCLRAGDAAGTYVLTTDRSTTGEPTATYQLVGTDGADLSDHVGRRVEARGVLDAQQQVTTRSTTDPAPNATATSGTPTVATTTQLNLRRLEVREVRQVEGSCEM